MKIKLVSGLISAFLFLKTITAFGQQHEANLQYVKDLKHTQQQFVVLNNPQKKLPVSSLGNYNIASVCFGIHGQKTFDSLMNKYEKVNSFVAYDQNSTDSLNDLNDRLKFQQLLVLAFSDNTEFNSALLGFIRDMEKSKQLIIVFFGNPKKLAALNLRSVPVLWCRENSVLAAFLAPQIIFGGIDLHTKLSENISSTYKKGTGFDVHKIRLGYTVPEAFGMNIDSLDLLKKIIDEGIAERAIPGAVVLVAKNGNVIFNKAYGNHTYDGDRLTRTEDIFDLASITKVAATTASAMRLCEEGKMSLDSPISKYIARTRNMQKKNVLVKEVMLHEAGFFPYIKFYEQLKPGDTSSEKSDKFSIEVADHFYVRNDFYQTVMWPQMLNDSLLTRGKFVYSDLSMYYMREMIEKASGQKLNEFAANNFYKPLGMQSAGYLPRNRFEKDRIVPTTEDDSWFRKIRLQGFVHDPGAAKAGGVSGHAGLFASANDLAILYQMFMNLGEYGGKKYLKASTIRQFTSKQSKTSGRGYGFARKDADSTNNSHSKLAAATLYGHSGYTGTLFWVDEKNELIYIFLSNRVYPSVVTNKMAAMKIPQRIQEIIYNAF